MAVVALKTKNADRRELCERLLKLRRKHADVFGEMDAIKAELIQMATDAGDGFREVFVDDGQITVSGCKGKEFKGHVPEVNEKVFDILTGAKRQKLIDSGVVTLVPHYTRECRGRVDLKVF